MDTMLLGKTDCYLDLIAVMSPVKQLKPVKNRVLTIVVGKKCYLLITGYL